MSKETLKLLLEALGYVLTPHGGTRAHVWDSDEARFVVQAYKVLEEALAKQEQGEPVGYIANKRQRLNVELKPNAIVWMPTATDWELPLFTTPQPDQDEVEIRSRLYQRIHELEDLLRDIAEYKGEGPLTTDYRAIVKSISLSARSALGEEI